MSVGPFLADSIRTKESLRPLVSIRAAHKDAEDEILGMLIASGAVLQGHFRLESGQHSSVFMRFANVAGSRQNVESITGRLISELRKDRVDFDAVLVQEAAGRSLGETIARKLGKRALIVETDDRNRPTNNLVNETTLYRGDRVLVVSDLSTTGSGVRTMTTLVREKKATPVAVALFATRNKDEVSTFEREERLKVYAVADLAFAHMTYGKPGAEADETECQECREGRPHVASWEI